MAQAHTFLDRNALLLRAGGEEAGDVDYEALSLAGLRKWAALLLTLPCGNTCLSAKLTACCFRRIMEMVRHTCMPSLVRCACRAPAYLAV